MRQGRGRRAGAPVWILALLLPLATACSSRILPGAGKSASEIEELQRRVLDLQRRAAMAEVEIARLRQTVADLELRARAGPAPGANPRGPTAPAAPLPAAEPRPTRSAPPATIEEDDLAEIPPPLSNSPGLPPPSGGAGAEATEPVSREAQTAYDLAYTLYHQGRFIDAETAFRRFLQTWQRTDLADNASYWIGECRYSRGDLRAALAAFQETVERFPSGNKTPDALFKAGQCLEGLGDIESARSSYQAILERYPEEPAAGLARDRLRVLG